MPEKTSELKAEFASVVAQLATAAKELQSLVADIEKESGNVHDDKGVSLLAVKNQSLLHYNMQVATLALHMSHGQSIAKSPCVGNVVDIRQTLDDVRPAEQRMAAELDRLVALTQTKKKTKVEKNEPRARPALMVRAEETAGGEEGDEAATSKTGKYVPPKVVPMHYSDPTARGTKSREEKASAEKSRRAVNSSLIRELHEQFTDAPVEVVEASDVTQKKQLKRERERKTYEESNYTRLMVDERKEKRARVTHGTETLNQLLNFGDYGMEDDARGARGGGKKGSGGDKKKGMSKKGAKFGKNKKSAGKRKKR